MKFPSLLISPYIKNEWNFRHCWFHLILRMDGISVIAVFAFDYEWSKFHSLEFSTFTKNEGNIRHCCSRLWLQTKEFASVLFLASSLECRNFQLVSLFFNGLDFISGDLFQENVLKILSNIFEKQEQECSILKLIKTKHVHDWQVKMETFSLDLSA